MSQALAWHTTSRSFGCTNSDRSQNVLRKRVEAERREEALAVADHLLLVDLLRLEQRGQVVAGAAAAGRRDQRVDVSPLLGPDVPEQVGGDGAVGGDLVRAVGLRQLRPHVGVERFVERADLAPEAVQLRGECVRRHVVRRPPHRAEVGEVQIARSLVGQLDQARVLRAHGRRDGVPARPHVQQLVVVAALGHDPGDCADVEAVLRLVGGSAGRGAPAVLALAVGRLEPGRGLGELRLQLRIARARARGAGRA